MTKIKEHMLYYLSLLGLLIGGLILIFLSSPNRDLQMIFLVGLSICYVMVGIIHHLMNHDLVGKIVVEYILIAVLGIAAAFFVFKGGFGF